MSDQRTAEQHCVVCGKPLVFKGIEQAPGVWGPCDSEVWDCPDECEEEVGDE